MAEVTGREVIEAFWSAKKVHLSLKVKHNI